MIEIRELCNEDYEQFLPLRKLGLQTDPTSFSASQEEEETGLREKFEALNADALSFSLGAFVDDQLVGKVAFIRNSRKKLAHKGELGGMFLHPDHRGQGISSLLLSQTLDKAFAQAGLNKVVLTVTEGNTAAKALYEKYGFITFGTEENGMVVDGKAYTHHWMHIAKEDWQS